MDAKKERLLNDMNTSARKAELGGELSTISGKVTTLETGVAALGKLVTKALVAGDINTGVATVDTGVDFAAWYSVMVTTAAGAPRVITKIEKGATVNKNKIIITATDVAATDIVSVIVK